MSVTIVTCLYGDSGYDQYVDRWKASVDALQPQADRIIVSSDRNYSIPGAQSVVSDCDWKHPQAFYLQCAFEHAVTDWVWQLDIDDLAIPNALRGLDDVDADVWQMGFDRSDGHMYIPPDLTDLQYLWSDKNQYVGSSPIRTDVFHAAGGFPDIALQDWGMWRRLVRMGATIEVSGRVHFRYMRHEHCRGETELTTEARPAHLAEMMESENAYA